MPRHHHPNQPRGPAGNSDGGQWTDGGHGQGGALWLARGPLKPSSSALHSTIQGALALFTWLSALNSRNQRAVVAFKAREYLVRNAFLDLEGVRLLNREEVSEICKNSTMFRPRRTRRQWPKDRPRPTEPPLSTGPPCMPSWRARSAH